MWLIDLQRALTKLEKTIDMYMVTITYIHPAYDGIVFDLSNHKKYKYWYITEECKELGPWR